jgi:hypothetical protein
MTNIRKTYTIEGDIIPLSGAFQVEIQCADKIGTFYVKIVDIKPSDSNTITVTGF